MQDFFWAVVWNVLLLFLSYRLIDISWNLFRETRGWGWMKVLYVIFLLFGIGTFLGAGNNLFDAPLIRIFNLADLLEPVARGLGNRLGDLWDYIQSKV